MYLRRIAGVKASDLAAEMSFPKGAIRGGLSLLECGNMQGQGIRTITVRELHQLSRQRPVDLIDVRTPEEFREVRATTARNMPMDAIDLASLSQSRVGKEDEPLYFICHLGGRSGRVCAALMAAGYPNVVNVVGGTEAWEEAGLPIERG
jgi:rhodanese-related sulfurtransferase